MRSNQNTNKNRHSTPYERPGTSSNGDNNHVKGLLSQVKNSVTEILSQSWVPSFLRYDATNRNKNLPGGSNNQTANDPYVPTPSTSGLQIKQIYPEEGTSAAATSAFNAGRPLMAFKLNNLEKYKSSNLVRTEPSVSSTPSQSSSLIDKNVGFSDHSTNPVADVSIIMPNITSQVESTESNISQTPINIMTNRSSVTKKGLRDTLNDSSFEITNSSLQNRSLPQTSAFSSKRPRFNASTYGSPVVNTSNTLADSSLSIFYPGKTMYGGAANYKKSKLFAQPKMLQRSQIGTQPAPEQLDEDGGLSQAAKRILSCLERMSTPISEAKKMPVERGKIDYFDSPYISDFHKRRPSLRTESPHAPPISSLLTPAKTVTRPNLASFLRKQEASTSCNAADEAAGCIPSPAVEALENVTLTKKPSNSIFNVPSAMSNQESVKAVVEKKKMPNVKNTQDSFKITSKKGIPQFDNSPIEVPDLPNISLPVTSLPTISFSSNFKPVPVSPVKNKKTLPLKELYNFKVPSSSSRTTPYIFSSPEVLGDCVLSDDDVSAEFVFSKPHPEKDIFNPASFSDEPATLPSLDNRAVCKKYSSTSNGSLASNWAGKFKPASDSWECSTCCIRNMNLDAKCVACQTPNSKSGITTKAPSSAFSLTASTDKISAEDTFKPVASQPKEAEAAPQLNGFGNLYCKKEGQWMCEVCLVDNKKESDSCVACMTAKPDLSGAGSDKKGVLTGFGTQFSVPKSDWECDVCLVRNKENSKKCVACGSLHPSKKNIDPKSDQVATGFTFGVSSQAKMGSNEFNVMPTSASAKLVGATDSKFSFGVNSTAPKSSSGEFKFGTSTTTASSSSTELKFGTSTAAVSSSSEVKLGSNTTTTSSSSGSFNFGSTIASTTSGSSKFKFGTNELPKTTANNEFQFGANVSSDKLGSSKLNFGANLTATQSSHSEIPFGSNKKTAEDANIELEFTAMPNKTTKNTTDGKIYPGALLNDSKDTTIHSSKPLLFGGDTDNKTTKNALPFDLFKKPPPSYNAKTSIKASEPVVNEGATDKTAVGTQGMPLLSNDSKIVNKENMFSFGAPNQASSKGFNFNPKQNMNTSNTSNALDIFSNKQITKSGKTNVVPENKSLFESTDMVSGSIKPLSTKSDITPSTTSSKLFSFKTTGSEAPKNIFVPSESTFSSISKPSEITTSNFSFGGPEWSSSNSTILNLGQDAKKSSVFSFGSDTTKENSKNATSVGGPEWSSNNSTIVNLDQNAKKSSVFSFGNDTPKENSKTANPGFNFGQNQAVASTNLSFSFGQKTKATTESEPKSSLFSFGSAITSQPSIPAGQKTSLAESEVKPSLFSFGNSNASQAPKSSVFNFGQPSNESAGGFPFGNVEAINTQSQPSFPIGQTNGETSSSMTAFGSIGNPFNATSSGVGPTKTTSRVIKKAVRRARP